MNKIDLIIENIEYAKILKESAHQNELLEEALAAARELQATYPQGAKVRPAEFIAAASIGVGADFVGTPMMWAEWPTRSEEVKHD
jgi:hypothetical protein